jgi:hypothetical protein
MGLFDEVICDYPLPGTPPAFVKPGHCFQTKDLDCDMSAYHISEDGAIDIPGFTGAIEFYTSNTCAGGWGISFTPDGADAESVEYCATFTDSRLVSLVESSRSSSPALPVEEMRKRSAFVWPTDEEKARDKARRAESLTGKKVYVLMGGTYKGYHAEVVADGEHEWCLKVITADDFHRPGSLVNMNRMFRDHLMWDSEEEAKASRAEEREQWETNTRECLELLAAKRRHTQTN